MIYKNIWMLEKVGIIGSTPFYCDPNLTNMALSSRNH